MPQQYIIFLNRVPGVHYRQNDPASIDDALFREPLDATEQASRRVGTLAERQAWCAAKWLPSARPADDWAAAYRATLAFRQCRFVSVYNWEGIRKQPEAILGLRQYLMQSRKPSGWG